MSCNAIDGCVHLPGAVLQLTVNLYLILWLAVDLLAARLIFAHVLLHLFENTRPLSFVHVCVLIVLPDDWLGIFFKCLAGKHRDKGELVRFF